MSVPRRRRPRAEPGPVLDDCTLGRSRVNARTPRGSGGSRRRRAIGGDGASQPSPGEPPSRRRRWSAASTTARPASRRRSRHSEPDRQARPRAHGAQRGSHAGRPPRARPQDGLRDRVRGEEATAPSAASRARQADLDTRSSRLAVNAGSRCREQNRASRQAVVREMFRYPAPRQSPLSARTVPVTLQPPAASSSSRPAAAHGASWPWSSEAIGRRPRRRSGASEATSYTL